MTIPLREVKVINQNPKQEVDIPTLKLIIVGKNNKSIPFGTFEAPALPNQGEQVKLSLQIGSGETVPIVIERGYVVTHSDTDEYTVTIGPA